MTAFPEEYRSLVPKVLVETMSELNSSFVSRVNVATGDAVPETRSVAKGILRVFVCLLASYWLFFLVCCGRALSFVP